MKPERHDYCLNQRPLFIDGIEHLDRHYRQVLVTRDDRIQQGVAVLEEPREQDEVARDADDLAELDEEGPQNREDAPPGSAVRRGRA